MMNRRLILYNLYVLANQLDVLRLYLWLVEPLPGSRRAGPRQGGPEALPAWKR